MSVTAERCAVSRVRVRVTGTVQGVGFRPFVFRLARELGLSGFVLNDSHGVLLEAEGELAALQALTSRLAAEAPPLAIVQGVRCTTLPPRGRPAGFTIRESPRAGPPEAAVSADTATCPSCLRELFDPGDRRYRYPFINCTDCGPRFTIVRGIPYDRPYTSMAGFSMCPACRREYEDPLDRRFHAQPNACPVCGPTVSLLGSDGRRLGKDPLAAAGSLLAAGGILAVKGLGGYHLACPAGDEAAVARLRRGKAREEKPLAVMVAGVEAAEALVSLTAGARELLEGPARPIVLCPRRRDAAVAPSVAPRSPELGVMVAYTPLHHLLLHEFAHRCGAGGGSALVMTSANLSEEPIAYRDGEALERLSGLADAFLVHDREIVTRTDDSVVRVMDDGRERAPMFVRRSRGYVPGVLSLPGGESAPALLACGAQLKNTFCLARDGRAWVSHHIGDLENFETLSSLREGVSHFQRLFAVAPELAVHDLHPDLLSTRYAAERGLPSLAVQHHHAHLAACLAEHGEAGPAVGAIFDGTGYGTDGTIWGGEILAGGAAGFARAGHLLPVALPGGEQAIRQPWRMACAWLAAAGICEVPETLSGVDPARWRAVDSLVAASLTPVISGSAPASSSLTPVTSSAGRLFDGVAALLGLRSEVRYEGQAAIELEAACDVHERGTLEFEVREEAGRIVIDPRAAIGQIVHGLRRGATPAVLATRFHTGLAEATARACLAAASASGTELVVLSGGSFVNGRLLRGVAGSLRAGGVRVLWPRRLPPGDGGVSYGQAAVAAVRWGDAR